MKSFYQKVWSVFIFSLSLQYNQKNNRDMMTKSNNTELKKKEFSFEDNRYSKEIANIIMQQIKYPNKVVYFTWGATQFSYGINVHNNPFLRFKVNGMKFKGYVWIFYNRGMDWYDIEFISTHGNLKHRIEEVYFDELQEKIDNYVEKIDSYIF